MNRFRFRLESVLRVRGAEEEAKKRDFGAAGQEVQKAEDRLNDTRREIEEHDRLAETRDTGPLHVRDLMTHYQYSRKLERTKESHQSMLKQAENLLDARRSELIEATRRRKTLERLRERALRDYEQAVNKEEQDTLDELTVQKYKPEPPREM